NERWRRIPVSARLGSDCAGYAAWRVFKRAALSIHGRTSTNANADASANEDSQPAGTRLLLVHSFDVGGGGVAAFGNAAIVGFVLLLCPLSSPFHPQPLGGSGRVRGGTPRHRLRPGLLHQSNHRSAPANGRDRHPIHHRVG